MKYGKWFLHVSHGLHISKYVLGLIIDEWWVWSCNSKQCHDNLVKSYVARYGTKT